MMTGPSTHTNRTALRLAAGTSALALILGWVRWRSGRLWPGILLHAWSNLAMIAYVLGPAIG